MSAVIDNRPKVASQKLPLESGVTALLARLRNAIHDTTLSDDPRLMLLVNEEIKRLTNQAWICSIGGKLEKSELVNEVWLKLLAESHHSEPWASREHFFNTVALTMQQVIVDHIRRSKAQKRISDRQRATIDPEEIPSEISPECIAMVADALEELESHDPQAARVVRLKYFGGYTQKEIMQILDISLATLRKHWIYGQTWIKTYLKKT